MKRPISMKCSQEQFDAVKDKLAGCTIDSINHFVNYPFLINSRYSKQNNITNYLCPNDTSEVHETWNEEIFLNACGIETEKIFKGSELQFFDHNVGNWSDCYTVNKYRFKPCKLIKKQELESQILELQNQLKNL